MLIEQTLDKLNAMKLGAMADALQQQLQTGEAATLGFEERFGLLADAEWTAREPRKLQRHFHTAKLRYPASLEAIDGRIPDFPVTRSHPPASWPSAANSSICRTYRKTAGEESRRRSPVANRWMRP